MTPLQDMAMEHAKAGDWQLADAMELVERSKADPRISGAMTHLGRLIYIERTSDAPRDLNGLIVPAVEMDGAVNIFMPLGRAQKFVRIAEATLAEGR